MVEDHGGKILGVFFGGQFGLVYGFCEGVVIRWVCES